MRRVFMTVGLAVGIVFLGHTVAKACGDKTLALSRGIRQQRAYAAARQASILIYLGGNSNGMSTEKSRLQSTLSRAGHKLEVAENANRLGQLLQSGKFDVVLADFTEVEPLVRQVQSSPTKPTVLPVMFKPTKSAFSAAEKQYSVVMRAPGREFEYLMAIDEAMKVRARASHT